jgi:hypothetical protein
VFAVVARDEATVICDQQVRRQTEPAALCARHSHSSLTAQAAPHGRADCAHDRAPRARIEQCARRRVDAKLTIQLLFWISDHGKRKLVGAMFDELTRTRVKHRHFAYTGRGDLGGPARKRPQVQVTHRAAGKSAELDVNDVLRIRQ